MHHGLGMHRTPPIPVTKGNDDKSAKNKQKKSAKKQSNTLLQTQHISRNAEFLAADKQKLMEYHCFQS